MRRIIAEALDVLWPVSCPGCGAAASALCDACLAAWEPQRRVLDGRPLVVLGDYADGLRDAVIACKEGGSVAAVRRLARRLAPAAGGADAVAVVPPSAAGLRRRGFHAAAWAARIVAAEAGASVLRLRFAGGRSQVQKGLSREQRAVADRRMRGPARLAGARVIVFDDVVTTGATMRAAAAAVTRAGARVETFAALAQTPRRHD